MTWTLQDTVVNIPALGGNVLLGIRNQNGAPWGTPSAQGPGNFAALGGYIRTNYTDGASIEFLSGAGGNPAGTQIAALNGGVYVPSSLSWNPNLYGAGVGGFANAN